MITLNSQAAAARPDVFRLVALSFAFVAFAGFVGSVACWAQDPYQDPPPPSANQYTFYEPPPRWAADAPGSLAVGDIGGPTPAQGPDTWLDVVVLNPDLKAVSVYRNTQIWPTPPTTAGLAPPEIYSLDLSGEGLDELYPSRVVLADMDKDNDLDIVVSMNSELVDFEDSAAVILRNNGHGTFTGPAPADLIGWFGLAHAYGLAVANFDVDLQQLPDILVVGNSYHCDECNSTFPQGHLIRQQPPGVFDQINLIDFSDDVGCGTVATDVVAGHFRAASNSAWPDAYISFKYGYDCQTDMSPNGNWVVSLINNGGGSFGHYARPGAPSWAIAAGRLRSATGYMDAAEGWFPDATNQPGLGYPYFNLNGDGTLTVQLPTFLLATYPFGVSLATIDVGSSVDVVLACTDGGPWLSGCVAIMFNNGAGTFPTVKRYNVDPEPGSPRPYFVKCADLDNDCRKDVIASCWGSNKLTVLINQGPPCALGGSGDAAEQPPDESGERPPDETDTEDVPWDDSQGPFW